MGAMFIGQQFLQNVLGYSTLQAGAVDPPGGGVHGARRAALGQDRRGARRAVHPARGLLLLPARLPHDAAALEGGHLVLEGRARLRVHRDRRRPRRDARVALADRLGAGEARRDGVGHRRPPARPRRRDHAVDLRRAAHRRLRGGDGGRDRAPRRQRTSRTRPRASSRSRSTAPRRVAQQYPQYASQITAAAKQSFLEGDQWAYLGRDRRDPRRAPRSSTSASRGPTTSGGCSPRTTPRTPPAPSPDSAARGSPSVGKPQAAQGFRGRRRCAKGRACRSCPLAVALRSPR